MGLCDRDAVEDPWESVQGWLEQRDERRFHDVADMALPR